MLEIMLYAVIAMLIAVLMIHVHKSKIKQINALHKKEIDLIMQAMRNSYANPGKRMPIGSVNVQPADYKRTTK